jgi:hypothetical protein
MKAAVLLEVLVKLYKITYFCNSEVCNVHYLVLGTALYVGIMLDSFAKAKYFYVVNVLFIILAFSTLVRYANNQKLYFMPLFK